MNQSVYDTITRAVTAILMERRAEVLEISPETPISQSGLDSLDIADLTARLDEEIGRVPEEALRQVGLDPQLTRTFGQYSQGMRQRMSLARALLNDPKILLLDEPFSNVDVRSAREMVSLLVGLRDAGKTIFVVTHQASLLEGAADEFVWMEFGKIVSRTADLRPPETRLETQ